MTEAVQPVGEASFLSPPAAVQNPWLGALWEPKMSMVPWLAGAPGTYGCSWDRGEGNLLSKVMSTEISFPPWGRVERF